MLTRYRLTLTSNGAQITPVDIDCEIMCIRLPGGELVEKNSEPGNEAGFYDEYYDTMNQALEVGVARSVNRIKTMESKVDEAKKKNEELISMLETCNE